MIRDRQTETERDRERDGERVRERESERQTDRQTEGERQRGIGVTWAEHYCWTKRQVTEERQQHVHPTLRGWGPTGSATWSVTAGADRCDPPSSTIPSDTLPSSLHNTLLLHSSSHSRVGPRPPYSLPAGQFPPWSLHGLLPVRSVIHFAFTARYTRFTS